MTKKHKFIDKLKSWLVTLGVAYVFGLAALGCSAAKDYKKVSAYDVLENETYRFDLAINDDVLFLIHYYISLYDGSGLQSYNYEYTFTHVYNDINGGWVDWTSNSLDISYEEEFNLYSIYFNRGTDFLMLGYDLDTPDVFSWEDQDISGAEEYDLENYLYSSFGYGGYQDLRNYILSYNAPQQSGNFITALTDFMSLLGGAIVQLAQPIANGVTQFAEGLFIDNSHLSVMGGIIGIFAGIALAVGITSKVYTWVTTLGN